MTGNDLILKEYLSHNNIDRLEDFSILANKSNAALHPLDQERWFDFIITTVKNSEVLPPDILQE
ncbi:MAG: hypothetical protein ACPK85_07560 [Methanosarcina sp.]